MTVTEAPTRPQEPQPQPEPQRKRWSRLQKIVVLMLSLLVVGVFAVAGWVWATTNNIERIPAAELKSLDPVTAATGPRSFLVVGSDSRENLPADFENFGDFGGERADVIMLARVDPDLGVRMLSLPRDLKVTIPGHGVDRINAAYAFGGPDLLVQTVQGYTGIEVNHYVEIDFAGFAELVDSLGGVTVDFPYAARDLKSGLSVEAGKQKLDGEQALAFARSRTYEELRGGSWVGAGEGDVARTQRQQELLLLMFEQATAPSRAFNLPGFVSTFTENIKADEGLSTGVLLSLARAVMTMDGGDIDRATLPVKNSQEGGKWFVVPVEPGAGAHLDAFRNGEPFPVG